MSEDLELIGRFKNGDMRAFEELVKKHKAVVYNTVCNITGADSHADDIAQDVFMKVYTSLKGFREKLG